MKRTRLYAGYLCVALGFAIIVMLGYGVIDPVGMDLGAGPASQGATSIGALLLGLLPSVLMAAVVFAIGLYLLKSARKP